MNRTPQPCDHLHAAWAAAYLAWNEEELARLDAELLTACTHPQPQPTRDLDGARALFSETDDE